MKHNNVGIWCAYCWIYIYIFFALLLGSLTDIHTTNSVPIVISPGQFSKNLPRGTRLDMTTGPLAESCTCPDKVSLQQNVSKGIF